MEQKSVTIEVEPLLSAGDLEDRGILRKSSAYRLAKCGAIPSYLVGPARTGVRFRVSEVLAALRRPMNGTGDQMRHENGQTK